MRVWVSGAIGHVLLVHAYSGHVGLVTAPHR